MNFFVEDNQRMRAKSLSQAATCLTLYTAHGVGFTAPFYC